jgi:catechol 2,3-dioxygenase-like lactoylglutathione lyase family enzyme
MGSFHHVGLVVSDIDESISFYERVFGAEVELRIRAGGEEVGNLHGLPDTDFTLAMLRIGAASVELFEFHPPHDGERVSARACDLGSFHVAIAVDDVRGMYRDLTAEGFRFTREPFQLKETEAGEHVVAFFADPDGNRIEIVQMPGS